MAELGKGHVRIIGVVVAILLAIGVTFLFDDGGDDEARTKAPKVGDCLAMSGTLAKSEHKEKDCGDPAAAYKVVSDDGTCDKGAELNYKISSSEDEAADIADLCLDLNASKGECFTLKNAESYATKVVCAQAKDDPGAVKIVSIGDAKAQCVTGAQPRKNATRGTLLCLGPAS